MSLVPLVVAVVVVVGLADVVRNAMAGLALCRCTRPPRTRVGLAGPARAGPASLDADARVGRYRSPQPRLTGNTTHPNPSTAPETWNPAPARRDSRDPGLLTAPDWRESGASRSRRPITKDRGQSAVGRPGQRLFWPRVHVREYFRPACVSADRTCVRRGTGHALNAKLLTTPIKYAPGNIKDQSG